MENDNRMKRYFSYIIYLVLSGLLFVSCSHDMADTLAGGDNARQYVVYAQSQADTRMALDETTQKTFAWQAGDRLTIDGTATTSEALTATDISSDGRSAKFTFTGTDPKGKTLVYGSTAIYGKSATAVSGSDMVYATGVVADDYTFTMAHQAAYFKFSLLPADGTSIDHITISGKNLGTTDDRDITIAAADMGKYTAVSKDATDLNVWVGMADGQTATLLEDKSVDGAKVITVKRTKAPTMVEIWQDHFTSPTLNAQYWNYETGIIRNEEVQWYQPANAYTDGSEEGNLILEGRKEQVANPSYDPSSTSWPSNMEYAKYTSGSVNTMGKMSWQYGSLEARAKIPTGSGSWPAIWTLGNNITSVGWPLCGEVDVMEYYGKYSSFLYYFLYQGGPLTANIIWEPWQNITQQQMVNAALSGDYSSLGSDLYLYPSGSGFKDSYHVWRMDWTESSIKLYLDDVLKNECDITNLRNWTQTYNPFRLPHFLLLDMAMGGTWGGDVDESLLPFKYMIDYVKITQLKYTE